VVDTAAARLRGAVDGPVVFERAKPFRDDVGQEGYAFSHRGGRAVITANSPRGILYGAYALAERGARLPEGVSRPRFPVREWQTAALQGNFNLPLGGAFDRPIEEVAGIVSRTIREAPRYGMNAIQLMGRVGEGIDVSWFLEYEAFPKLRARRLGYGLQRRIAVLRRLADEAHRHGLDFLIWDHEIAFPAGMLEAYPEIRGVDYPVCFSHPFILEFVNAKFDEFFRRLPEVDGIDLTFAETRGYNLLEHGGCKCERCARTPAEQKIRRVLLAVYEACRRHGKRMEVRSYNQSPRDAAVMRKVLRDLPKDLLIVTKNSIVDFRGLGYPDDPLLGAFGGHPQALELTATPEGSGYGYIPALLGGFYKEKIGAAAEKGLAGVAIRTDYHLQYGHDTFFTAGPPVLTFDTPNDFNVYVSSRLAWDPALDMETLWSEWAAARKYPAEAVRALRRSAAISQGIFFVKGFSLLSHLNMVPHLATIDAELKDSYLLQFFPDSAQYRRAYEELAAPDERVIGEVLAEKQRAVDEAALALKEAAAVPDLLPWFRAAENAARLWKQIAEVYFRLRQRPVTQDRLDAALRALLAEAYRIERRAGIAWPVYPAARGATVYEFAREALERGKGASPALDLWSQIVEAMRPGAPEYLRIVRWRPVAGVPEIRFAGDAIHAGGLRLPLAGALRGPALDPGRPAQLELIPDGEDRFEARVR
jgi:hypothetical protein